LKKLSFNYKNLLLFDELAGEDAFDFEEDDKELKKYNEALRRLKVLIDANKEKTFKIPPAKPVDARWALSGEKITFGNYKITAGFFYFGTNLPSECDDSRNFSALVNPNISIPKKKKLDAKLNMEAHTIDYAELTGIQRRRYVLWHCGGRTDKNIHDWFAMLFLYGLERRIFIDGIRGLVKQDELILIRNEVRRILEMYGGKSMKIRTAYSNFLAYLELECADRKLYDAGFPNFECKKYREDDVFTAYINTALSQCAKDGIPVNACLAYYWYVLSVNIRRSDIAVKCMDVFKELFIKRCAEIYEKGFLIKKTKKSETETYEFIYKPECAELNSLDKNLSVRWYDKNIIFGQKTHINKLEGIAARCERELAVYAQRRTKSVSDAEALLALPPVLWTGDEMRAFQSLKEAVQDKRYLTDIDELKIAFFRNVPFSKTSLVDFAYALETENIGMEPDIISFPDLINGKNDKFILHKLKGEIPSRRTNITYSFCRPVTELAVSAYRLCKPLEKSFAWYTPVKLDDYFYDRIIAYVVMLMQYPPPLQQCINRLKTRGANDKKYILRYIREDVLEDCNTSYEGISVLEKLYKGFGFPKEELYAYLHGGGDLDDAAKKTEAKNAGVSLDKEKIKKLREDSDHVYSMLSDIFKDDEQGSAPVKINSKEKPASKEGEGGVFNFDAAQTLFLKKILSRTEWTRDELAGKAKDEGLMLDGFMEIVNETAYNEFDDALLEGDEIITVNTDIAGMIMEKL
jgi:hypothetical protein